MTTSPRGEVEEATADAYLWMSLLPSWLRAVFSCLYVPMLQPSDDALARFRKLFLAVSFVPGILVPLVFATLNAATLPSVATTSTTVVASVAPGLAVPYWVCIYWLARRGTFSAAAMSALWTYGTLLLALLLTLSCPDLPMDVLFVVLFVVALLLRVPFMPIAALMPFAGFVIASHNAAAYSRGDPDVPLLALPDVAVRAYAYRVASSGVALVAVLVIVAALYAQLSECDRQTSQAAATSALALAVAQRLGEYDTTGARAVLDETDTVTDETLRGAMKVLIDNLDKYRPHLPNWVVGDTEVPTHRLRAKVETDTVSLTSASSRRVGDHAMVPSTRLDRSSTGSDGVRSGWLRGGQAFESFASSVLMRFTVHDGRAFTPESSASMTAFVDTVHRLAGQTGGAVHSFVGDALSMSWNAASRVSQSEAKSVRMMARLKKAADAFGGKWHFVAAIQSGKMCVQLAGGVESRQQALTLTAPWSGENLHRIMQVASPLGHGVVCDHRTRIGAEHVATFRALAAASTTHDPRLGVYELLGEHEDGGEMEEWLYIMAKQQAVGIPRDGGDARLILDALDCWTKGDDVGASKLLNLDAPLSLETVSHAINTRCGRVATTASSS